MKELDITKLKGNVPTFVYEQLEEAQVKFNVNTVLRMGHFLAQIHHESAGFSAVRENLNYGKEGLLKTFPRYFKNLIGARNVNYYARNPQRIANLVYANRMGNGNEASGDGWLHRGYGLLQLTGKNNQYAFAAWIGDEEVKRNPELIATKYPLLSAVFFFETNDLWKICDKGDTVIVVTELTKRVNGGTIGLKDRIGWFCHYMKILNS